MYLYILYALKDLYIFIRAYFTFFICKQFASLQAGYLREQINIV